MQDITTTKPLKVLNASAGSGKTYRLVQEYIELLLVDSMQHDAFKHLLAMTFTNKAALEMKERIIAGLDGIGTTKATHKQLTDDIASALSLSVTEVVERCNRVLEGILHRYEDFHVMTIDKFNLRLIKSFSRDLDLPGEFEVVLDETELIEQIVDDLLNQLGNPEKERLNRLMLHYAKSNIDDEKGWSFRRNLIAFGSILKNERHRTGLAKLQEMEFTVDHYQKLQQQQKSLDKRFIQLKSVLQEAVEKHDTTQFHGGKNTLNDLGTILKNNQFPIQPELIKKRLSANLEKDGPKSIPPGIREPLLKLNAFWEKEVQDYTATTLFLRHYFNMALLQYMANALEASREEAQLLRISEFNDLISALIQDENAPFIYERLGNRYHHFLLDEFQDTSHLQWLNLIPLIHDSLSNNRKNLIVGDPKQSIYRFKNGIAEQFVALPAIYNPKKDPEIQSASNYFQSMGTLETLHNNWRSSPSIVTFNTRFFETFRDFLPETTADFYNAVSQEPKSKRNGAIHIESLETKDPDDGIIQQLIDWIEDCLDNGYDPSDLCILGRRNRECNAWAIALDQAGYKVVSADSLLIDTSAEVRLAIRYLQWRAKPSGESEKKQFAELYFRLKGERYETYRSFLRDRESQNGRRYREFDDTMFIQTHFGSREAFFFKYEHLYDLLQGFFQLSGLQELQNPYLHHLADWAHEFGLKKGPNLNLFLEEYERKKNKIAVQIPAAKDAINIMTIHKSKGLEFPVVMLPSLNISLQSKSEFLIDYNDFLLYKKPSKEDVLGPLISLYTEEKDQVLTDIVNLTYVAMTRPIDRLFIRNHFEKNTFGKLFHQVLDTTGLAESQDDMLTVSISAGTPTPRSEKNFGKLFYPKDIHDHLWFPEIAFQDSEELRDSRYLSDEVQMGISFHLMASRIYHKSEINSVVQSAISSGELLHSHADFIRDALNNLWESPDFLSIVSETDTHITEQDILLKNGQLLRVDALFLGANATVIVDYKTGVPSPKDSKQLQTYTRALSDMGYPNVNGYAYYTSTNELRLLG